MPRSFTLLLLLVCLASSCMLPLYKLTVSSDAYAVSGSDKFHTDKIFVDDEVTRDDLSKLPYLQKIRQGLTKKGVDLVDTEGKSDLVLVFDVVVQAPLKFTHQGTEEGSPTKSSSTKTNPDGTSETVEVVTPGESRHYSYDYHTYDKVLTLKLYTRLTRELVWQSESVVNDDVNSYGPYANSLVYTALLHFLRNTSSHPKLTSIGPREQEYMKQLLNEENQ